MFNITVTNIGSVNLTNVEVTDVQAPGCAQFIGNLAAGASTSYPCEASDVTESFTNEACAEGAANGGTVDDCDEADVEVIDIDIRKQAEGADSRTFASGSNVSFDIVVTNTGDEGLSNVEVSDPLVPDCDETIGNLAAGESVMYTCTANNVTEGFVNVATVTGERNGVTVMDDDPSTVITETVAIDIRKQAEGTDSRDFASGADVTFEIVVTNTGQSALTMVTVTDPLVPDCAMDIGNLASGASVMYTCTADDVTEDFTNIATVSGKNNGTMVMDSDPSTVLVGDLGIDIRKQDEGDDTQTFASGSTVSFEIEVTNTGELDLENVEVTDAQVPGCAMVIGDLAVGASENYTCMVNDVTESFTNEACVEGERDGVSVDDCDPSDVEIIAIDIRKQAEGADSRTFAEGADVTFEIEVTNTGDEDLSDVEVSDPLVPDCDRNIGDLAAGASTSYICTATNVIEGFLNEATVTGERNDVTVMDSDPSTVVTQTVDIDIRKEAEGPDSRNFTSGSNVTFSIVVTNTGQLDLTMVTVTDPLASDCAMVIGNLASGASVSYDCTASNVTEDFTNIATVTGKNGGTMVMDSDPSSVTIVEQGGQGCTPGYWRQDQHFDSWTPPYDPTDSFASAGFENAFPGMTLEDVVQLGGGGLDALGRHTVAALLNAASPGVSYDLSVSDVINMFNSVFPGTDDDYEALKDIFADFNEQGCPLN